MGYMRVHIPFSVLPKDLKYSAALLNFLFLSLKCIRCHYAFKEQTPALRIF